MTVSVATQTPQTFGSRRFCFRASISHYYSAMRILAADDDPTLRLIVKGGLRAGGHDVVVVETGAEAWDLLKKEHFPIVVTDWMMPGLDGIQLTSLIRKTPRESYTYVI